MIAAPGDNFLPMATLKSWLGIAAVTNFRLAMDKDSLPQC